MIISCPRCDTSFSLPEDLYKPGKKARCSNCGFVFAMPEMQPQEPEESVIAGVVEVSAPASGQDESPAVSKSNKLRMASILVTIPLVLLLLYGGYLIVDAYLLQSGQNVGTSGSTGDATSKSSFDPQSAHEQLVSSITLDEIRQFLADNMEIGKLMVIQGYAVNNSESNKDYISIEARVLDENNNVLAKVQQLCGVPLSLFQIQSLSEQALQESLNNRTTILVNNTNVAPGGKVPFVVIFPNPPESMRTFEVQVVDVRESVESPESLPASPGK